MAKQMRCNRCFAPVKNPKEPCEFCGYNIFYEMRRAEMSATKKKIRENLKKKSRPDGVALDEKVRRLKLIWER